MVFLRVKDLHSSIDGKEILTGLNLDVNKDEVHAIMGPNNMTVTDLYLVTSDSHIFILKYFLSV